MKWTIYYIVTLALNAASLLLFHEHINISAVSAMPILLLADSIFQAAYYHNHKNKELNTAHSVDTNITDEDWAQVTVYIVYSNLLAIPLFLPFIWFFSWGKLLSFVLFLAAFAGGGIWYRVKHGNELHERHRKESKELEEQRKREELGKFR